MNQYLTYLYEIGDKESAKKAWEKMASYGVKNDRGETLRHIEFLIALGDLNEASRVWKTRLREEGLSIPSDENLITNGGFETKEILGGGFDWKMINVPGAEVSFDHSMAFEGKRSLKIVFNGKENVDFRHVYQFVALKPTTRICSQGPYEDQGCDNKKWHPVRDIRCWSSLLWSIRIIDWRQWMEGVDDRLRTPAQSQGGVVRVRREKTDKFDRFISGTVWIDNVSLTERKQSLGH